MNLHLRAWLLVTTALHTIVKPQGQAWRLVILPRTSADIDRGSHPLTLVPADAPTAQPEIARA